MHQLTVPVDVEQIFEQDAHQLFRLTLGELRGQQFGEMALHFLQIKSYHGAKVRKKSVFLQAMNDDTYYILATRGEGLYKEKGSKFIAETFTVMSEDEAKAAVASVKKKYFDARHHCFAYMIGPDKKTFRSSDDGEPSGTAGKPILNQILSKDVTNVCVVVTRYFGGIKLGTSGLINAYKTAARDALENAQVAEKTINEIYSLEFEYPLMNEVMRVMKEENLEQQNSRFELDCYLEFSTRKNSASRIFDKFSNLFGVKITHIKTI
jgi:uncharacterized YigZ family protein